MKRFVFIASLIIGIQTAFAADFSAVSPNGDILYYKIIDNTGHKVSIVHPGTSEGWGGYTKPTGNLVIPSTVNYGGIAYTVTVIDDFAFSFCDSIITVSIPNTVKRINVNAFKNCYNLVSVDFSQYLDVISHYAFYHCHNLSSITLPTTLDTIGRYAFSHCYEITSIVILDSVKYIGNQAFYNDSSLSFVIIGNGCRYIGSGAFVCMANYTTIRFRNANPVNQNTINTTGGYLMDDGCFSPCSPYSYVRYEVPCGSYNYYDDYPLTTYSIFEVPPYGLTVVSSDTTMGQVEIVTSPRCCNDNYPYDCPILTHLDVEFTANANYGYHFSHWSDGDTSSYRSLTISSDTVFNAFFYPDTFSVSVSTNNTSFGLVQGSGYYPYNSLVEIEAIPENHYHFLRWSDGNQDNPRQIQVLEDVVLCAIFVIDTYQVSVTVNDMQNGQVTGGGMFEYGQPCTVYAMPYSGYGFSQWSDGSTYNPYTFAVVGNVSLTAMLLKKYVITCTSANTGMGTVTGSQEYLEGEIATLTAIPYSGYRFDHWQDNNTQNPRTITVTNDATYTAYFVATQGIGDASANAANIYTLGGQIIVETDLKDEISIYDIVGRKVDGSRNTRFDVPASGVYLVKIGILPTQKVVVVK